MLKKMILVGITILFITSLVTAQTPPPGPTTIQGFHNYLMVML